MSYDPGDTTVDDDDSPFVLDALGLAKDDALLHFFQSLEELIAHGQHEVLLLSALGNSREIDAKLLEEAKVPVFQKAQPEKPTKKASTGDAPGTPSSSATPTASSTGPASSSDAPTTLTRDTQQAELIAAKKLEAEKRKKAEKKHALKKWLGPLVRDAAQPSPSPSSTAPAITSSHAAHSFPPPTPITLLISNLALYTLPPAIPMKVDGSDKHFLILNQYHRIALQDILLVSLPYRSGISLTGGDYALRINDFCLHLRSGKNIWLQSPAGRRSGVVEVLSDAYRALLGHSLQMDQPDYLELVSALNDGSIVKAMKQMRMEWWAMHPAREQGWLIHRSIYERPPDVLSPTNTEKPVFEHEHDRDSWSMRWFVLTRDNYLLQFTSPAELEAFRLVMNAADSSVQSSKGKRVSAKFPANFDCIEIDLTRAAVQHGGAEGSAPEWGRVGFGFEVLVFPRGELSGTPVYDKGHTRHLFTAIPPFSDKMQASWKQGDSPAQLLQELQLHYSKKPSVVIPLSSSSEVIEPPSPASAQAIQADALLSPAAAAEIALAQQAPTRVHRASFSLETDTAPFYPPGHPLASLRFPVPLVDGLKAATQRWFTSVEDAINFNQMGGTRSAEDSVGARAAVKGRTSIQSRPFSPSSTSPTSPFSPRSPGPTITSPPANTQLFKPMVDPNSLPARVSRPMSPPAEAGDVPVKGPEDEMEEIPLKAEQKREDTANGTSNSTTD